ncbi:hypothetical protein F5Y16DRAFT_157970 [Xylariaceae sp. FL0255]|nr:hypothetical protein F5Y16DRAFT_157970 [Xylariaceae sp. FL0255]
MASHLTHTISQLPGFITEHSKRKLDRDNDPTSLDLDQFFDFPRFYADGEGSSPGRRSRSDASSDPGLTSGPSEEDGAPSPGSMQLDDGPKDDIRSAKQHDDHYTIPQREIRPKGGYPRHLELPSPGRPGTVAYDMALSPPDSPILYDATVESSGLNRGKRCGPLANAHKVAEMRKIGACDLCKARKVSCNKESPCSHCSAFAEKILGGSNLAHRLCIRTDHNMSSRSFKPKTSGSAPWEQIPFAIVFAPSMCRTPQPDVCVSEGRQYVGSYPSARFEAKAHTQGYKLGTEDSLHSRMIAWASKQMKSEFEFEGIRDLQSALDMLLTHLNQCLPNEPLLKSLVESTFEMRCLYRLWKQDQFCYCMQDRLVPISQEVHQTLKFNAAKNFNWKEEKALFHISKLEKQKTVPDSWRLLLWVCLMELVLLYRDMHSHPEPWLDRQHVSDMFNSVVVFYEIYFGKKQILAAVEARTNITVVNMLEEAVRQQMIFYEHIATYGRDESDDLLRTILAHSMKQKPNQQKRRKTSHRSGP